MYPKQEHIVSNGGGVGEKTVKWVIFFFGAYIWVTATNDWGWNGWVAFFFVVVCVGLISAVWQAIFGKGLLDEDATTGSSSPEGESKGRLTDTALKVGAGYAAGKLFGEKKYAYQCRNCNHYEERSQHQKFGVKCPRCGRKGMQISKI